MLFVRATKARLRDVARVTSSGAIFVKRQSNNFSTTTVLQDLITNKDLLRSQAFIGGQWQGSHDMMDVLDPATNQVRGCTVMRIAVHRIRIMTFIFFPIVFKTIAQVASLGAAETEDAITAALDSWTDWRQLLAKGDAREAHMLT